MALLMSAVSVMSNSAIGIDAIEPNDNYARLLQYSMYFYDANMCGTDVSENTQYSWRGDCHTYDATLPLDSTNTNLSDSFINDYQNVLDPDGDGTVDVSGGFHDAGDHVKFGLPEAYAGSTVGWGYYEFRESYEKTGQAEHVETLLRYFNDYFMRCTFLDDNGNVIAFCYQVGDGDIDHDYWNAPEVDEMERKGWFATSEKPTTDCICNTVASLAVNYLNFKDSDPEYADKCLKYAKALFKFADENEKSVGQPEDGPKGYYASNKWEDDYSWGAVWLYMATGDESYMDKALATLNNDYYAPSCWTHCWNDVWNGVVCLIAEANDQVGNNKFVDRFIELTGKSPYENIDFWSQIAETIEKWQNGSTPSITPAGYAFLNQWGSARYNTATQFLALVYDKHNYGKANTYSEWAKGQMDYLLGDNPNNKCYVVGLEEYSVKYPHHRAASGLSRCEDTSEQKHILYGALVGGPGANDEHIDTTADYIYNEVTIDYNAAFVGASAGLYYMFGDDTMLPDENFPPFEDSSSESENGSGKYWVVAFSVDIIQDEPKTNEITFYVCSDSSKPSKNISVRYYFDITGMNSIATSDMEIRELYDQVAMETEHDATLSKPIQYKDNIYYVEISFPDYAIANSNKKYQFALGTYAWQNSWNPNDDWSYQGIKVETNAFAGTVEKTDYICVYDDGVLVGGIEPDGSTPEDYTTVTTTNETTITTEQIDSIESVGTITKVTDDTFTIILDTNNQEITYNKSEVKDITINFDDMKVGSIVNISYQTSVENPSSIAITMAEETTTPLDTSITTTFNTSSTDETDQIEEPISTLLLGDVTLDGQVMGNDLLMLKKHVLGLSEITDSQALLNADISQDGQVMGNDLLMLKKHVLGLTDINNN